MSSCLTNNETCIPSADCDPVPWDSGWVDIELTYETGQPEVGVILYNGYVEDDVIIWSGTVTVSELSFYLPVGRRYAVEAYYSTAGPVHIALDGKKLRDDTYDDCGETCYNEPSVNLNVTKK